MSFANTRSTPLTPPAPRRRPRDRRDMILEAAAEMFAEHGHAGIGVHEIAKRVGITGAAIYRHFSGKEELLECVFGGVLEDFCAAADAAAAAAPADQLRTLLQGTVELAVTRGARVATYLRERRRVSGATRERLRAGEQKLFASWDAVLQRANPPLGSDERRVRQRAVQGGLVALALQQLEAPRSDLDSLFVEAFCAVILAAPAPTPAPAKPALLAASATWSRPRSRRQQMLQAAATLFRRDGYHGVGVDQIGEAVGIAGPTVYGTYPSKADILIDAYDYIAAQLQAGAERALNAALSPEDALHRLAASYARLAYDSLDLLVVANRDRQALPESDRVRIGRRRADNLAIWTDILREIRPDLLEPQAETLVLSSFSMAQQVALDRAERRPAAETTADMMVTLLTGR